MSNGIFVPTSFVPPIHTRSVSKAFKQGHAPRRELPLTTALVCVDCYRLNASSDGSDYSADAYPSSVPVGLVIGVLHRLRVPPPEPGTMSHTRHPAGIRIALFTVA